jgi:hypothetical protein
MAAGVLLVHRRVASELAAPKSRRTFCKRRGNGGVRGKHGLLRGAIRGHLGAAGAHRGQSLHLRPREALRQRGEVVVLIGGVRGKHGLLRGAVRGHLGAAGARRGQSLHFRPREARRRQRGEDVVVIGGVGGKHGLLRGAVRGHLGDAGAGQGERLHLRSREARRRCGRPSSAMAAVKDAVKTSQPQPKRRTVDGLAIFETIVLD